MKRALLALALAACSRSGQEPVKGRDFSFVIPAGWSDHATVDQGDPADLAAGSISLAEREHIAPDAFHSAIFISPTAMEPGSADLADLDTCRRAAAAAAKPRNATVTDVEIVDGPTGKACEIEADVPSTPPSRSRATFIVGAKSIWVVTCNRDPKDTAALDACGSVIASWKFDS